VELSFLGQGKRQPPEQPRPVAVTFGTAEERALWERLFFIKYLLLTHRIGRGDVGADDG
jgi:hypothetical protein